MTAAERIAAGVVRAWTRAYTAGAASEIRDARRAEIESDLWEHVRAGADAAAEPRAIAGQVLARCLLGVGADLSWRVQTALGTGRANRAEKEGVPMSDLVKRDWWVPAPIVLIVFGIYQVLTHILGDGYESPWERTPGGWDPSLLERVGPVSLIGFFFVVLPLWAIALRRRHPGWTLVMLVPWILYSMIPLMWSDAGSMLVFPALGLVTAVGAIVNLARASVEARPDPSLGSRVAD
jgi:hypothetical protein